MARTDFDWSKHTHRIEIFKSEENEIRVDHLQIERNKGLYIKFTNAGGNLTITGDFGNWIFCRSFVPNKDFKVCEGYWLEKLETYSIQKYDELDFEKISQEIKEFIEESKDPENYGEESDQNEAVDFWEELLEVALSEDRIDYDHRAFRGGCS